MTGRSLEKVSERKAIKDKINATKSERLKTILKNKYTTKDKEVKNSVRADKRTYMDDLAKQAENAANRAPSKVLGTVIIVRIRDALDNKLRKEQAGFRRGKGFLVRMSGENTAAESAPENVAEHVQDVPSALQSSQPHSEQTSSQQCSQQALSQQAPSQQAASEEGTEDVTPHQLQEDKENIDQAADEAITMQKRLSDPGSQPTEDTSPAKKQKVLSDAENKVPLKEQATV
ncbi:hypothetical protein LSAT2_032330 [Lamellibrachia satsuma]|nr:hypothetical protein LSAT2_032330 [Lamellibrachia satsuma]